MNIETIRATEIFRWWHPRDRDLRQVGGFAPKILQQAWASSDGKIEWRELKCVYENEEEAKIRWESEHGPSKS